MKVRFTQSGGFAGALRGCELNTSQLASEEAAELEQLVEASDLPPSGEYLSSSGRDLFQYELEIDGDGIATSVVLDDHSVPATAKPLLGYLKKHAKPLPRK